MSLVSSYNNCIIDGQNTQRSLDVIERLSSFILCENASGKKRVASEQPSKNWDPKLVYSQPLHLQNPVTNVSMILYPLKLLVNDAINA